MKGKQYLRDTSQILDPNISPWLKSIERIHYLSSFCKLIIPMALFKNKTSNKMSVQAAQGKMMSFFLQKYES